MNYWTKSKYSKTQIDKAGEEKILEIINEFRYDHEIISEELLKFCEESSLPKFSARRLKRTPSIINKIRKSKQIGNTTRLSNMQDIAGCRCVFENIEEIKHFIKYLKKNLIGFEEVKIINYIDRKNNPKGPKKDGYRGIHIIYKYCGENKLYQGLFIELQLRTRLQHYWATAVEIIDLMYESKIKNGGGDEIFRDFFKWSSIILENREKVKTSNKKKAITKIKEILADTPILDILNKRVISYGLFYSIRFNQPPIKGDLILEITKESKSKLNINWHSDDGTGSLKDQYLILEQKYKDNINKDLVYLSSSEIENAYPNYIGNANEFIKILKDELKIK